LADAFYRHKTNIFTFQLEKLNTYLSLESTYPYRNIFGKVVKHDMLTACRYPDGKVIGFCEVDDQPPGTFKTGSNNNNNNKKKEDNPREAPRPYMCNLAVDRQWTRKGVAKALVKACEDIVLSDEWRRQKVDDYASDTDTSKSTCSPANSHDHQPKLHLKVRSQNEAALQLYRSLGYIDYHYLNNTKINAIAAPGSNTTTVTTSATGTSSENIESATIIVLYKSLSVME
jgi:ribosomal protein S18 acetylase RimI-like enzyme